MTDAPPLPKRVRDKLARMGAAFDAVDALLLRLGQQGLQRMTPSSLVELGALQQTAHNAALITVERQIETLATQVERYLGKDPLFTMEAYAATINRIWLLNRAARALHAEGRLPDEMVDVIGETRRKYTFMEAPLTVQPLGASGWVTDTGFVGITLYLFSESSPGTLFECTATRPTMYFGTNPRRLMRQPVSDYITRSVYDLSHGAWSFHNAKVSRDGRLSLHKELTIDAAPYMGGRAYRSLAVGDWTELLHRLREGAVHPVRSTASSLVFCEPAAYGELVIDEKRARAVAEVRDGSGASLQVEVSLRQENNFLVDNLERLLASPRLHPTALFGRAWIADGRLKLLPITAIYDRALVLAEHGRKRVNEVHLSLEDLSRAEVH